VSLGDRDPAGTKPDAPSPQPSSNGADVAWRRCALGGGAGMFVGMGLGRFSYTAMVPALIESGTLTPLEAGRVGGSNLAGFFLGAVVSVPLAAKFGRVAVLWGALAIALIGLAGSALPVGFAWLAACRASLGVATALIMVLSLALIAETAPADRRPEAGAYVFAGVGLGISSSGILVPWLLTQGLSAAWLGILLAGLAGCGLALWGWRGAPITSLTPSRPADAVARRSIFAPGLASLMLAHALFSFGIVPHTIYWVDYVVRGVNLGSAAGGLHWTLVGLAAALGPLLTTLLARTIGTGAALVAGFAILAVGISLPALWPATAFLFASSIIFGAQPGLSSLMAARARDLGDPAEMPRVMRAMILANAAGGVLGGLSVPWVFAGGLAEVLPRDTTIAGPLLAVLAAGGHAPLFLLGGAAMALGALFAGWRASGPVPPPQRQAGA